MQRTFAIKTIAWFWACAIVLAPAMILSGCAEPVPPPPAQLQPLTDEEKMASTREWLQQWVETIRFEDEFTPDEPMSPDEEFRLEHFERALASLEHASIADYSHPKLIMARIRKGLNSPITLVVTCLAAESIMAQVHIADSQGTTIAQCPMELSSNEGDEHRVGIMREGGIAVSVGAASDNGSLVLELAPKYLTDELWVSVIEEDGTRSDPVRLFILPEIRDRFGESSPANSSDPILPDDAPESDN